MFEFTLQHTALLQPLSLEKLHESNQLPMYDLVTHWSFVMDWASLELVTMKQI